jgi:hypothetical protein
MLRNTYLVGLLVIGLGLGGAYAQTNAPDAAAPAAPAGQYCAVNVDPVQPGAKASVVKEVSCFATFAEALAVATDGTVRVDPKTQPHEFTKEMLPAAGKAGRTVIAVDWSDANYKGEPMIFYSDQGGCVPGRTFEFRRMPRGWNDVVSSMWGAGGCDHQFLFEHIDFNSHKRGKVAQCHPNCKGLRVMNDKTSSQVMAD